MDNDARKVALRDYRERKVEAGIFSISCAASREIWVGRAPDLSTIRNRLWFTLTHGSHRHPTLQAAWNDHGMDSFRFAVVEALPDEETTAYLRDRTLKEKLAYWRERLGALAV